MKRNMEDGSNSTSTSTSGMSAFTPAPTTYIPAISTFVADIDPSSFKPPPRTERRTRRRLPPTPSLAPSLSSLPVGQPNAPKGAGVACQRSAGRFAVGVIVKESVLTVSCVKQGRVCSNCLPARTRACQNLGTIPAGSQPSTSSHHSRSCPSTACSSFARLSTLSSHFHPPGYLSTTGG